MNHFWSSWSQGSSRASAPLLLQQTSSQRLQLPLGGHNSIASWPVACRTPSSCPGAPVLVGSHHSAVTSAAVPSSNPKAWGVRAIWGEPAINESWNLQIHSPLLWGQTALTYSSRLSSEGEPSRLSSQCLDTKDPSVPASAPFPLTPTSLGLYSLIRSST